MEIKNLINRAKGVLLDNLYEVTLNGQLYRRTVPSKEFYIHQWNWDSATYAMGLVYVDEQRAFDELKSLKLQKELIEKTIKMISLNGFYEYFDPKNGLARPDKNDTALGFGSFSWTAAITVYLLYKYSEVLPQN